MVPNEVGAKRRTSGALTRVLHGDRGAPHTTAEQSVQDDVLSNLLTELCMP